MPRGNFLRVPWLNNVVDAVVHAAEDIGNNLNPDQRNRQRRGRASNTATATVANDQIPQHQQQQREQQQPSDNQRAPPASSRAIRQLATIRVAPEDLVEPCNRECCICLEENHLYEKVTRLPCAHIFHSECLLDWLTNHHCTCPVCRYELPTDDPQYEAGRMQRMKARKPRFAMYELQRMSVPQLLKLNKRPAPGILEKRDLIQTLIDQDRIQLIPAPEPVEYKLETLQAMGVSQLKRTMEDAGVFFHPNDVVEKSDMLTIFHNSGRLVLIPEIHEQAEAVMAEDVSRSIPEPPIVASSTSTNAPETASLAARGPVVETVMEDSDDEGETKMPSNNVFTSPVLDMFGLHSNEELLFRSAAMELNSVPTDPPPSARTGTPVCPYTPPGTRSQSVATDNLDVPDGESDTPLSLSSEENAYASANPDAIVQPDENTGNAQLDTHVAAASGAENGNAENHQDQVNLPTGDASYARASSDLTASLYENGGDSCDSADADSGSNSPRKRHRPLPGVSRRTGNDSQYSHGSSRNGNEAIPFRDCTISELQAIARDSNIDLTHCFERREMVQLLITKGIQDPKQIQLTSESFSNWSVSQLRALASAVDVDLSQCSDREEMLYSILHEANHERPHLRNYLRALSPLAKSSLPQLRGVAREWKVNISDCLEKEEIIQRLISRGKRFAAC